MTARYFTTAASGSWKDTAYICITSRAITANTFSGESRDVSGVITLKECLDNAESGVYVELTQDQADHLFRNRSLDGYRAGRVTFADSLNDRPATQVDAW